MFSIKNPNKYCELEFNKHEFEFEEIDSVIETYEIFNKVLRGLERKSNSKSGPERMSDWEKGWEENLNALMSNKNNNISVETLSKY